MEPYNNEISDITYMSELTPITARKYRMDFRSVLLSGFNWIIPFRKMYQNSLQ